MERCTPSDAESSAMVIGAGASARISRARMPRESVWEWAAPDLAGASLEGIWASFAQHHFEKFDTGRCACAHILILFYIRTRSSTIEHKAEIRNHHGS